MLVFRWPNWDSHNGAPNPLLPLQCGQQPFSSLGAGVVCRVPSDARHSATWNAPRSRRIKLPSYQCITCVRTWHTRNEEIAREERGTRGRGLPNAFSFARNACSPGFGFVTM
eukprot:scaffold74632_cov33-Tisochrysis_lutea.AAC.5